MASGRIPIPLERAEEIANVLDINPRGFIKMVLKQRYPNMPLPVEDDVTNHLAFIGEINRTSVDLDLSSATPSQLRIVREVLWDDRASERWLSPHEVFFVNLIRKLRPDVTKDGLSFDDLQKLRLALGQADYWPQTAT
jgi:hypothetical protein